MKKVIVGSTNPVKINAAIQGFYRMFPNEEFKFEGIKAQSGVSDQPIGNGETLKGALNRAKFCKKEMEGDFFVGMEGGVQRDHDNLFNSAWIVVMDKDGKIGKSRTADFQLPSKVADLIIKEGLELGDADDVVFKKRKFKTKKWFYWNPYPRCN